MTSAASWSWSFRPPGASGVSALAEELARIAPRTSPPRVLLFDLGGVIIDVASLSDIESMLVTPLDLESMKGRWPAMGVWEAFELGKLTAEEFAGAFVDEFPLSVTPDAFLEQFESWNRCVLPGAAELLTALRPRFRLAALSNTNALHWRRLLGEFRVAELFDRAFASHEMGMRKPDPMVFEHVIRELDVPAEAIVFFDDLLDNIEGARAARIEAYQVRGVEELRSRLSDLGCV